MIKLTETVKHLIIINVILFIATMVFKEQIYDLFAMHFVKNPTFKPWQIISHMFMHSNFDGIGNISIMHILFNMLGLWMFGSTVEQMLGRNNFLYLYFGAGIGAVLLHSGIEYYKFNSIINELLSSGMNLAEIKDIYETTLPHGKRYTNELFQSIYMTYRTPMVGASGALYGVMVAFGVLQPKAKMGLMFLPIMIEARIFIPLMLLADMFFGIFSIKGSNIAHFAHIGGAIVGFIIIMYLKKNQFKRWF